MCVQVAALTPNLPAVTSAEVEIATLGPGSLVQGNCKGHALCSPMHHHSTGDSTSKGQRTCRTGCTTLHRAAYGTAEYVPKKTTINPIFAISAERENAGQAPVPYARDTP